MKKKLILSIVAVIAFVAVVIGIVFGIKCYQKRNLKTPEQVAQEYIEMIMQNDYSQLITYIDVPEETPLFSTIDIMHQIYNSKYSYIAAILNEEYKITVSQVDTDPQKKNDGIVTCRALLIDVMTGSNVTFDIDLIKKDKEWKVIDNEFYVDNFYVLAPSDAIVTINGKDITHNKFEIHGGAGLQKIYSVPYVGCAEKDIAMKWENEQEARHQKVFPSDKMTYVEFVITADGTIEMCEAIKDTWQKAHEIVINGGTISDIQKLLHPNAKPELAEMIFHDIQVAIESAENGIDVNTLKIVDVHPVNNSPVIPSAWLNQDKMRITFNYEIQWIDKDGAQKTMKMWENLVVQSTDDNIYKIVHANQNSFFWSALVSMDQQHFLDQDTAELPDQSEEMNNEITTQPTESQPTEPTEPSSSSEPTKSSEQIEPSN